MTEKTTIFGWMILGKGGNFSWCVAVDAVLFRLFLFHFMECHMIIISGQMRGCLFWCGEENYQNCCRNDDKENIENGCFFHFSLGQEFSRSNRFG